MLLQQWRFNILCYLFSIYCHWGVYTWKIQLSNIFLQSWEVMNKFVPGFKWKGGGLRKFLNEQLNVHLNPLYKNKNRSRRKPINQVFSKDYVTPKSKSISLESRLLECYNNLGQDRKKWNNIFSKIQVRGMNCLGIVFAKSHYSCKRNECSVWQNTFLLPSLIVVHVLRMCASQ